MKSRFAFSAVGWLLREKTQEMKGFAFRSNMIPRYAELTYLLGETRAALRRRCNSSEDRVNLAGRVGLHIGHDVTVGLQCDHNVSVAQAF